MSQSDVRKSEWKNKTLKKTNMEMASVGTAGISATTTTAENTTIEPIKHQWAPPTSESLQNFLNVGVNEAFRRPWHRLERGLRLNRLNLFAQEEKERVHLTDEDSKNLYDLLVKSLDKKVLNSKSTVTYDTEKEKILEIKGLISHRNATGQTLYQIVERKIQNITFRKPRTSTTGT